MCVSLWTSRWQRRDKSWEAVDALHGDAAIARVHHGLADRLEASAGHLLSPNKVANAVWSLQQLLSTGGITALPGVGAGAGANPNPPGDEHWPVLTAGDSSSDATPPPLRNVLRAVEAILPRMHRDDACNKAVLSLAVMVDEHPEQLPASALPPTLLKAMGATLEDAVTGRWNTAVGRAGASFEPRF